MTPRHLVMLAGLGLSAALVWFGNTDTSADLAEPIVQTAPRGPLAAPRQEAVPKRGSALPTEQPILELLDRASVMALDREGQQPERLFAAQSWAPAPAATAPLASAPVAAPVAPALPFSYIGRQAHDGQVEVFLAQGDTVHVVRLHSLLGTSYRVDAISPTAVSLTYLPLNTTQQLSIGASD